MQNSLNPGGNQRKKSIKSEFFIDLKTGSPLKATKNININKVRP